MKYFYSLLCACFCFISNAFLAQELAWQRNIQSNTQDFLSQLSTTIDGQFLLSGSSIQSQKQDAHGNSQNNGYDFHVIKMNQQGQLVWEKYFGGNQHDFLTATTATQEGGFLLAGTSYSSQGLDKKEQTEGGSDIWIIKLSENGEEEWQKSIGTRGNEEAKSVVQSLDLGYFVAGSFVSTQDSKGFGSKDVWVVRLDKKGKIIHESILGGTGNDDVEKMIPTQDGGVLLGVYSRSGVFSQTSDGFTFTDSLLSQNHQNKNNTQEPVIGSYQPKSTENFGEGDYWVIKLNKNGKVEWEKNFGGKGDDRIRALAATESGFIVAGESQSSGSGNKKTSLKEGTDLWLIALTDKGDEIWQKSFSFGNRDVLMSLNTIYDAKGHHTKGFLLGGYTQAEGKTQRDDETFWMMHLDSKGEEVWRKHIEGKDKKKQERLVDARLSGDSSYVLAGTSAEELGKENWKIVKLADKQIEQLIEKQDLRIYPNPVEDYCYVEIGFDFDQATIQIYDMSGKLVQQLKTPNKITKLNTSSLPQGVYIITANTENQKLNTKIVKK